MLFLDLLKLILALASFVFIGYPFSYLLIVRSKLAASDIEAYTRYKIIYGSLLNIIISFYIGSLISVIYLLILSLIGINFSFWNVLTFSSIFFLISITIFTRYKKRLFDILKISSSSIENVYFLKPKEQRYLKRIFAHIKFFKNKTKDTDKSEDKKENKAQDEDNENLNYEQLSFKKPNFRERFIGATRNPKLRNLLKTLIILLIAINFLVVLFFAFLFPIRFWDAISCYSLKAKAFFIDKNIFNFFENYNYTFSHNSYPPFLSLIETWIYLWIGSINENLVKLIFPTYYLSAIFLIFTFFKKKFGEILSLILAFVFGAIPIIVDHGYIEYNNFLFSIILFVAVYFFSTFISNEISEINEFTTKKQDMIKTVKDYFNERRNFLSFDLKVYNDVDSIFRSKSLDKDISKDAKDANKNARNLDYLKNLNSLKIDKYRKYSHLYLSAVFFGILLLIRSEGVFYAGLFLIINIIVYLFGFTRRAMVKRKFKKVLVSFDESFYENKNNLYGNTANANINLKNNAINSYILSAKSRKARKIIDAKFIKNGDSFSLNFKIFMKKIFLPIFIIILTYLPWYLSKLKISLPFLSPEWQKALQNGFSLESFLSGAKRAFFAFTIEGVYSVYDSTRAFFSSFYGAVLIILFILFLTTLKKAFTNGGTVFFLFIALVLISTFISIVFVPEFEGSIERYILPAFPLSYYWIMSNTFKVKTD